MMNTTNNKGAPRNGTPPTPHGKANRYRHFNQGIFNKAALPAPAAVLARMGIKPGRANAGGYMQIACPFHKAGEEKNASLSMHNERGNFKCFACGAHGGDVLSFWMQHTGQAFKQAAMELGAWKAKP